jgi:hypothetical protein
MPEKNDRFPLPQKNQMRHRLQKEECILAFFCGNGNDKRSFFSGMDYLISFNLYVTVYSARVTRNSRDVVEIYKFTSENIPDKLLIIDNKYAGVTCLTWTSVLIGDSFTRRVVIFLSNF